MLRTKKDKARKLRQLLIEHLPLNTEIPRSQLPTMLAKRLLTDEEEMDMEFVIAVCIKYEIGYIAIDDDDLSLVYTFSHPISPRDRKLESILKKTVEDNQLKKDVFGKPQLIRRRGVPFDKMFVEFLFVVAVCVGVWYLILWAMSR